MDALRRNCTVTATRDNHLLVLQVTFPPNYPYNAAPTFQFGSSTTVDTTITNKLLKVLKHTAQQRVKTNKSCLEPCLRQFVNTLDQVNRTIMHFIKRNIDTHIYSLFIAFA